MNDSSVKISFSQMQHSATQLNSDGDALFALHRFLSNAISALYSSGLQGYFLSALQSKNHAILNDLQRLADEINEQGSDLRTVSEWFLQLDMDAAALLGTSNRPVPGVYTFPDGTQLFQGTGALYNPNGSPGGNDSTNATTGRYSTSYSLGNVAWDAADITSHLWLREGAGEVAAKEMLSRLGLSVGRNTLSVLGGGAGGLMDYGIAYGDQPFNPRAFATEVSSGLLQGAVTSNPVGGAVMTANTVVQLGGHTLTYVIHENAEVLAGGDPAVTQIYQSQADTLTSALDKGNLDNAFDAVTENVIDMFVERDVGRNLGEMAKGVGDTALGTYQIAFEYRSYEAIEAVNRTRLLTNTVMDWLNVDDRIQQQFNQSATLVMQDIQTLDVANPSSFVNVAQQRLEYFDDTFGKTDR